MATYAPTLNMYYSDNVLNDFIASRSIFEVNDVTDNTLNVQNECTFHTINELICVRDKTLSLSIFDNDDVSDLIDV